MVAIAERFNEINNELKITCKSLLSS